MFEVYGRILLLWTPDVGQTKQKHKHSFIIRKCILLKLQFCIEKLGYKGVYNFLSFVPKHRLWVLVRTCTIFLSFVPKHRLWVLVRTASMGWI